MTYGNRGATTTVPQPPRRDIKALVDFAHGLADLSDKAVLPHFRKAVTIRNKDSGGGYDPVP